jgi:quinol monooxygenase YgiN
MGPPLTIMARIRPRPEYHIEVKQSLQGLIGLTVKEEGCLTFDLYEGEDDGCLYLFEQFVDEASFRFHHEQDYTKSVFASYDLWLIEMPEVHRMRSPK